MSTKVRPQVKAAIDQAVLTGAQPTAPRNGVGLVLKTPIGRFGQLVDKKGLTSAGKYFYEQTGLPLPASFDFQQDATRKGRSQYIKLMDGSKKKVSTWDPNAREWKSTALGKQFFSKAVDRYTVLWPVAIQLTRTNGSIYERIDWLPSTGTELGEIEVPRTNETAQRAKVASIEAAWRGQQPMIGDRRALVVGYESATLDTSREIQFNRLSMGNSGTTQAAMHRPLREGKPWAFHGLEGVSEDAYEQTEDRCVSYQLSKHLKIKGGEAPWSQEQIAEMLWNVTEALYESDDDDNPPEQGIGYSAAAITQLCKDLAVPIHIKWQNSKIESFVPERSQFETLALYIWGDHCFCVTPETAKQIARESISTPVTQSSEVLASIGRRANSIPACQY